MLGSDEKLLNNLLSFSTCIVLSALLLRLIPPFLHPVVSYITRFLNRVYKYKSLKIPGRYIQQQLEIMEKEMNGGSKSLSRDCVLTWLVADALHLKEPREDLIDRIVYHIFVVMFASVEVMTMTMSHALFDVCASDSSKLIRESLAGRETGSFVNRWTWQASTASHLGTALSKRRPDSAPRSRLWQRTLHPPMDLFSRGTICDCPEALNSVFLRGQFTATRPFTDSV